MDLEKKRWPFFW